MSLIKERNEKKVSGLKIVWQNIKKHKKQIFISTGAIALCCIIVFVGIKRKTKTEQTINNSSVVDIIGLEKEFKTTELANEITDYLILSEKINDFMKKNRIILVEEEVKENAENTPLQSAQTLSEEIEELEKLLNNTSASTQILNERIKKMMIQEIKTNEYLYNSYNKVDSILETALRAYIGEKYGILDVENIRFYNNRFYYKNFNNYKIDLKIVDPIAYLGKLTTLNDPNKDDNSKYNRERNETLKKGLKHAENLFEMVNNKALYSEKYAKKLEKKEIKK